MEIRNSYITSVQGNARLCAGRQRRQLKIALMSDYKQYSDLLWPKEKYKLALRLFGGQSYRKEQVDELFSALDIEEPKNYALLELIAHLGFRRKWLYFPQEHIPRLSGLVRYNNARSRRLLNEVAEKCSELERQRIPAILTGDLAASFYSEDALGNMVVHAEIIVPSTAKIRSTKNIRYPQNTPVIDRILENILKDAQIINFSLQNIKIPCIEDLTILLLMEAFYWITSGVICNESLQWGETLIILADKIDWQQLQQRSTALGISGEINLMLLLFEAIVPGVIPSSAIRVRDIDTRWIERRFRFPEANFAERLCHYVPDKRMEAEGLKFLGLQESNVLNRCFQSITTTFRKHITRL